MGRLDANAEALRTHAVLCEGLATDLGTGSAPVCPGSFQSTTAAVSALHGAFAVAGTAMADRMRSTAAALRATADGMQADEQNSAARLRSAAQ